MPAFELLGQYVEGGVVNAESLQLFHRRKHVFTASARPAMTLAREMQLLREA